MSNTNTTRALMHNLYGLDTRKVIPKGEMKRG